MSDTAQDSEDHKNEKSLRSDRLFQLALVIMIVGLILGMTGTAEYYSITDELYVPTLNSYGIGLMILLIGLAVLLAALSRYVSRRMSDRDTWWIIKTGPTARPN